VSIPAALFERLQITVEDFPLCGREERADFRVRGIDLSSDPGLTGMPNGLDLRAVASEYALDLHLLPRRQVEGLEEPLHAVSLAAVTVVTSRRLIGVEQSIASGAGEPAAHEGHDQEHD
jgi:hypothetical protein